MDNDFGAEAGQSYRTVQLSAKEVLAAGRRQHYCNMIDLLASSCKSSGLIATGFTDDELVEFWLGDILPLMFDEDRKIQDSAVAALAEALVALDVAAIHSARCWPQIRSEFVNKYTTLIGEMRDAKNSNWHKIWTLLVQIMDEDLLRGCVYINKFLALVELGFRNPDNGVRSEAFLCWRVLIKIFAAYDELASVKRLRLLLIPLRTSQSRSSHVSGIKLRVWWYLLTCLDQETPKSFDSAVEHFLAFMFGGGPRNLPSGLAHNYQTARELALPCLVALWGVEPSIPLQRLLRELRLETFTQPSPLMSAEVLQQHWKPLLAAAVSGLKLLTENDATEAEQLLLQLLVRNLCLAMFRLAVAPFNVACCSEIEKILLTENSSGGRVVRALFNTIASESLAMERVAGSDHLDVLEAYLKLILKSRSEVPAAILQRSIACIFAVDRIEADNQNEFRMLGSFAELLMQANDEEDFEGFAVKLQVWRQVSQALSNYLRNNALEYRVAHNASLLDTWLSWPLQTLAAFAGRRASNSFDGSFCEQWRQLLNAGQNAPERKKFLTDLKATLTDLYKSKDEPLFGELFDAYVSSVLKLGLCKEAPLYKDVFGLLQTIFEQPSSQQMLEACLNTLRNLVLELRQNELMVVFDSLKPTLSSAIQCWNKLKCEGSFLEEWKRAIQEKFRKLPMKSMANQLRDLFKGDDLFVIIPSVWSLNPEKLTDRQKERFAEKSDIPALYNDMSQSQDSAPIKPWTPKKVVISRSKQGELALTGKDDNEEVIDITPSEESEKEPVPAEVPTPIRKHSGRKSKAQKEEEAAAAKGEEPPKRQTRTRAAQKDTEQATLPLPTPDRQLRSPRKVPPPPPAQSTAAVGKQTKVAKPTPVVVIEQSEDLFPEIAAEPEPQPEPVKKPDPTPETQLTPPDVPVEAVLSTQLPGSSGDAAAAMAAAEISPKKASTRICNLNSPPDRKQTNNSSSPTLRPKPTGHLTGRGAQLINMIRNKKLDAAAVSPYASMSTSRMVTPARLLERAEQVSTPTSELNELTGTDNTSTPLQAPPNKDLLTFSKRLPSPSASPSVSILKRKLRCDSLDDVTLDSPALKRKRVSFHDPPVSVTKEYLRDSDETRSSLKPKRCLLMDKVAQTSEMRQALRRRGRLDSIIEIERFASEQTARTATTDKTLDKSTGEAPEEDAFTSLKWNDTGNAHNISPTDEPVNAMEVEPESEPAGQDLALMDADSALDLVVEQLPLESVLQRYFDRSQLKSAGTLAKFLSAQMGANEKLKTNVLETLSENHSKDFLDHAVRENLSSVVCDRLNPNSVLEYVCAKSKISNSCRSGLLAQVPEILKSGPRSDAERLAFVQQLLVQCSIGDSQLLDLIDLLMRTRLERDSSTSTHIPKGVAAAVGSPDNVAETAADSSSNL
ncbi:telomere-associated protein RIF1 [Drosophila subpulchrella]|uniref:telomere-associated protein RIF1 n=1 Tax=Drosophila subpulchrella TaxID=1486046 RepID=UPI0018A12FD6|nr:telomere-associated protein RIF1 [Drosophila subpulchrella]